jgi:hypothetical protein
MILFSSKKLEKSLATGTLTQWQQARYFLILSVISFFPASIAIVQPKYGVSINHVDALVNLACFATNLIVIFVGFIKCFRLNEAIDNAEFIRRYFVLSIPVAMRLVVYLMPISAILGSAIVVEKKAIREIYNILPITYCILGSIIMVIYFLMMMRSFRRFGLLLKGKDTK